MWSTLFDLLSNAPKYIYRGYFPYKNNYYFKFVVRMETNSRMLKPVKKAK